MKYRDPSTGNFKDLHVKVSDTVPIGAKMLWHSTTAPEGWLICDGSAVSRTTYSALFAVIGTTYGSGNGSTTFNLPDYRDRVPVGYDANDSDFNTIGKKVGSKDHLHTTGDHTLTENEIPGHRHNMVISSNGTTGGGNQAIIQTKGVTNDEPDLSAGFTSYTGGGQAHNHGNTGYASTIQPSIVTNYIIKAYQVVAAPGKVRNTYSNSTDDVYSTSYVNSKNTYSTDETDTGKTWVDGKKIYRKVVNTTTPSQDDYDAILFDINNLQTCTYLGGFFINENQQVPINSYYNENYNIMFYVYANGIHCKAVGYTSRSTVIIIEYTKTS